MVQDCFLHPKAVAIVAESLLNVYVRQLQLRLSCNPAYLRLNHNLLNFLTTSIHTHPYTMSIRLYRQMLREATGFSSYNMRWLSLSCRVSPPTLSLTIAIRVYATRRVKEEFRKHAHETNPATIATLQDKARENLGMLQRQVGCGLVSFAGCPSSRTLHCLENCVRPVRQHKASHPRDCESISCRLMRLSLSFPMSLINQFDSLHVEFASHGPVKATRQSWTKHRALLPCLPASSSDRAKGEEFEVFSWTQLPL